MDVVGVVQANRDHVMQDATERLHRRHLKHYEVAGPDESLGRLDDLLNVVLDCLDRRNLVPNLNILGDNLPRTWLSLATSRHVPSLDMTALFEGSTS
jgi:hypothetical protein